jgi:CheY-like chemotaxis protein
MRILILEDDDFRITHFIEKFYTHSLKITEDANNAIWHLSLGLFDVIFLDNDLGDGNGYGADVAAYLEENPDNLNNQSQIIIHSWNVPAAKSMMKLLPNAIFMPFNSDEFNNLSLDKG